MSERKKILYLGNRRLYHGMGAGFKHDVFLELFREELARQHDVLNWGWGYRYNWEIDRHLSGVIDFFGKPDIVLADAFEDYTEVGISDIDALKVHIMGDFYYGMRARKLRRSRELFKQYDVLLAVNNSALLLAKEHFPDKKCYFWPWSVDTNFFRNYDRDRPIDVFWGGSALKELYGRTRGDIKRMVKFLHYDGLNTEFEKKFFFGDYVDVLNASKIAISNNSKFGFITKRIFEIMACGALLLTDKCEEFDMLDLEDGKHMVVYNDIDDLREKIYYYLANDFRREEIALDGCDFVTGRFSTRNAVYNLMEILY